MADSKIQLFAGSSHPALAQSVAGLLATPLSALDLRRFSCNEIYVKPVESVRNDDVYVFQTGTVNVNEELMELFIMLDAFKRSFASKIHVVMPHFPYARQDRVAAPREPISARLVADLISTAGADHLITFTLHSDQEQGFFNFPVDNLNARKLFVDYFKQKQLKNLTIVAPDVGSAKEAQRFAKLLDADLAILNKIRSGHNVSEVTHLVGTVKDRTCIMYDDMVDTAGSVANGAETLRSFGAGDDIYLVATHAVLSGPAVERLQQANFKEIVFTDTIPVPPEKQLSNMKILSVAALLAQVIDGVHTGKPLSPIMNI
ncbi:phosphoribosylpyrophosphate synthetase [Candidatus Peregrinibacteria bacterium CG_4_9_14_0_2_um_filter_53_11]|nr:MAG: phosphoribosylpyrophosphate synthetase [Candidatus Peregrinibacteria bacterium CG_4_9_14_0_2_um_filter_53_11]